jgi:hypothetical protein
MHTRKSNPQAVVKLAEGFVLAGDLPFLGAFREGDDVLGVGFAVGLAHEGLGY